jgi:hypothetical protein
LKERHGFLRGLVAFVGFNQSVVEFDRTPRAAGESHYQRYIGSIKIGLNGVIGFSNVLLTSTLIAGPMGLPTLTLLIVFLGGMQLVAIGILGEYTGRIYDEVKERPPYIVDRFVNSPLERHAKTSPTQGRNGTRTDLDQGSAGNH